MLCMCLEATMVLRPVNLTWTEVKVHGDPPDPRALCTFTSHHSKDIYLVGGIGPPSTYTETSTVYKLSLQKMKWKRPVCLGRPPDRRWSHNAAIVHQKLFLVFGRDNSCCQGNVMTLDLIDPSDRRPAHVMAQQDRRPLAFRHPYLRDSLTQQEQEPGQKLPPISRGARESTGQSHRAHWSSLHHPPLSYPESGGSGMDSGPLDWPVGDRRSGGIHLPFIADLYDITTGRTSTRHGIHSLPPALSQLDNSVGHIKDRLRLLAREKTEVSEARELLNHDREMQNRLYQTEMQRMTQRFDKERKHTQALRAAHQEEVERARRRVRAEQMETLNVKSYYFFVTPSLTLRWLIQQGIKWLYWICHGDFRTHWISTLAKYDQSLFELMRNKTDQQKQ